MTEEQKIRIRELARAAYRRNPEKYRAKSQRNAKVAHLRDPSRRSARVRARYARNPTKIQVANRKWVEENRGKSNAIKVAWRNRNPEKVLAIQNVRRARLYKTSVTFRLAVTLRNRLREALKMSSIPKQSSAATLVGCSILELKLHLESLFLPGMSWDNHGVHGWHVDHIRPVASFDLADLDQQRQCFHYINLQPLWAVDNRRKGDKYE